MAELWAQEEALNRLLPAFRLQGWPSEELLLAAEYWSETVWKIAEEEGPYPVRDAHVAQHLALDRKPVFVCGVHRSGTTLMRDLLDGHPHLSVLPSEGNFLTSFHKKIVSLPPSERMPFLGCEWLRRLANPINQAPYWLLGRTTDNHAPYVLFARMLMAWWPVAERHLGGDGSLWPHIAVALAYTSYLEHSDKRATVQRWVEKTPTNEFYLGPLLAELPAAKIVHVVRHPGAVYASRKRLEVQTFGAFTSPWRVLSDLGRSHEIAAEQLARSGRQAYFLLRYEDLIRQPRQTMQRLAAFLEIEMHPSLLHPTVVHKPAYANSSFHQSRVPGAVLADTGNSSYKDLTDAELERVAAYTGDYAHVLGYPMRPLKASRKIPLKATFYLKERIYNLLSG